MKKIPMTLVAAAVVMTVSCGGGGGGGSSANTPVYSGSTAPIVVGSASNAVTLSSTAIGQETPLSPFKPGDSTTLSTVELAVQASGLAENVLNGISGDMLAGADLGSETGDCGGSASASGTYTDDGYGGFVAPTDITVAMNDYCLTTSNGQTTWDGTFRLQLTTEYTKVSFSPLQIASSAGTMAFNGYIQTATNGLAATIDLDMRNTEGKVYRMDNVSTESNSSGDLIDFDGTFCDPTANEGVGGCVVVSTDPTLGYVYDCENPISGTITLTGADATWAIVFDGETTPSCSQVGV